MADPIETAVFPFEGVLPELDLVPLSARRALDLAGIRLSLDGWRSLSLSDRRTLALAGASEDVHLEDVFAVAKRASPPAARIAPVAEPHPSEPPPQLLRAIAPPRRLDGEVWAGLRALERYALTHAYRRAITDGALGSFGDSVDAILASTKPSEPPRSPLRSKAPGAYSSSSSPLPPPDVIHPDTRPPSSPIGTIRMRTIEKARPKADAVEPPEVVSTHLDARGAARMVDVGAKAETVRCAVAFASVSMRKETAALVARNEAPKGEVLGAARIAGILAAKRTPELVPLCHAVALTSVAIELDVDEGRGSVDVWATVEALDRTGVEMEALVGVSVACLTIYDMLKGVDRDMVIGDVKLLEKSGGRSGPYRRDVSRK